MKVSYKWLNEWIDLKDITPEEIADKLTNAGIEVDYITYLDKGVKNVVIGKVLQVEKHPDADKLRVCNVDVGESEPLQIVCGAPNVAVGQQVPVAKIGAVLPGDFKIKKSKLRGIESQGMICSAQELGLDNKFVPKELQEGIYVFSDEHQVGCDIRQIFNMDDVVLDLDLTPNRSDCLSMRGVAYELSALFDRPIKLPSNSLKDIKSNIESNIEQLISLEVKDDSLCPRYTGRLVKNVTVSPSPMWLRNKLQAAGIRSINNIVDITNLILLEYGQPLHAFDYNKINDKTIIVRRAYNNETIKTLDEAERQLMPEMLVIADKQSAIAIAGVMGGFESEVTSETKDIFIESAYFNSNSVRKTSTAFGLRSEASIRFEKGTDPNIVIDAVNRAASLMVELAGGEMVSGIIDSNNHSVADKEIQLSVVQINNRLGTDITKDQMIELFKRLQFKVIEFEGQLIISVPTRRQDINLVEDLSEEVARLYGYDNIPTTLPIAQSSQGKLTDEQKARRRMRDYLLSVGWDEAVSYSFINSQTVSDLELMDDKYQNMISLKMPLSEERKNLRTTLLPSMLELAAYNNNHKNESIQLFELGKVFLPKQLPIEELPLEKIMVAGIAYGNTHGYNWSDKPITVDFYYVKGIAESIFNYFGILPSLVEFKSVSKPSMHPGQTASIIVNNKEIGYIGQLHPKVVKMYDLPKAFYFEIDYQAIFEMTDLKIQYQRLPKYPTIKRDLAIVINQQVNAQDIKKSIAKYSNELLTDVQLFDVYAGKGIADGKKSIAYSLTFNDPNKTLTDEEVQTVINNIVVGLEQDWQAELRS